MLHMHLPSDARIVDEIFSLTGKPKCRDEGWLMAMVATYGKTPSELKGFTWNEDNTINIPNDQTHPCLLYTSPSPRDRQKSRMPSSA